jgi:HPt (histidine-containing phosphotransfer) domain-containing protein
MQGAEEDQTHRPLDLETAVYEFGGRQLVRQVIDQLIDNGVEQMEEIHRALSNKEIEIVQQRAHAIKGGAATAEARPLSGVAAELEELCKTGELDHIPQTVERLEAAWVALRTYVQTIEWQQEAP